MDACPSPKITIRLASVRKVNMRKLRVGMSQINVTVGDFDGNTRKILEAIVEARASGVDLLTFPELAICGYPPEDLLFKPQFIDENLRCLNKVVENTTGIAAIVGFVDAKEDIYNAAAIINDGKLCSVYHKIYLPNYGVFDENRYFQAGSECPVYIIGGIGVGVNICEDIWYEAGPATVQAYAGAEVIVNISSSPYHAGKRDFREWMLGTRAVYMTLGGGRRRCYCKSKDSKRPK
jgi:NAD+ synthase (glutamine-hydrolysing)